MIYKLKEGNIVKVIAPSSYIEDEKEFFNGIEIIKSNIESPIFNDFDSIKKFFFIFYV